jgi:hypothetical protein
MFKTDSAFKPYNNSAFSNPRHRRLTNLGTLGMVLKRRDEDQFKDNLVNNQKFYRITQTSQGKRKNYLSAHSNLLQENNLPPEYDRIYEKKHKFLDRTASGAISGAIYGT